MGLMPAFQGGDAPIWCLKDVLVASGNRARGLDSHQGAILLHDGTTGEPLALVDATAVTALRTAATSAVATLALAR
ncbi:ornithine cyclodeaminase family protein, partial [Variovorax sp. 2RAF20]